MSRIFSRPLPLSYLLGDSYARTLSGYGDSLCDTIYALLPEKSLNFSDHFEKKLRTV